MSNFNLYLCQHAQILVPSWQPNETKIRSLIKTQPIFQGE